MLFGNIISKLTPLWAVLFSVLLFSCNKETTPKQKKYIAYVGRYTEKGAVNQPDNTFDKMHEYMLRHYLKEINPSLPQYELDLKTYDCQRDPLQTNVVYQELAGDTNVLAVIDNTWASHLSGAYKTIQEKNIPVIAINADHNGLEFGPQAIFTGNNDMLPNELALFLQKILKEKDVVFVSEEDYALHNSYVKIFQNEGINMAASFTIQSNVKDKKAAFERLCAEMAQAYKSNPELAKKIIVINLHFEYGTQLLRHFDEKYKNLRAIGHAYIIQTANNYIFGKGTGNELILINNPTDAVSKQTTIDMEAFKKEQPDIFAKLNSPMFPKRCQDAVAILKSCLIQKHVKLDQDSLAGYFMSLAGKTILSDNDLLKINLRHELQPDLFYVRYKEGRLYSYREQLNAKGDVIPNLVAGMEIIDLYNVDVSTNTFMADFYYWVKADIANQDAERFILFPNMKEEGSAKSLVLEKEELGQIYKLYKVSGLFHQDFNLKNYPFDKQEIVISMEIMAPSEKLKIAFDQSAFRQDTNFVEKFKVRAWEKDKYLLTVDNRISSTMRGDPESVEGELKKFQVFSFRLFVTRTASGPFLEIILPLFLIGLVAISLLFVRDLSFGNVGEVSVGTFLAIITFSIAIASVSPASDYITKSDILFWLTFAAVLLCFLTIIIVNSIYDDSKTKNLKSVQQFRIVLLFLYVVSSAWVVYM